MTNLLELIKDNPTLPIYAWVDGEVCGGDEYNYWLGQLGNARKAKITLLRDYYFDDKIFEYEDKDEIWAYFAEQEEYENLTDEEIWNMVENLHWEECILVHVGTPDNL